jgi:hypothetical protein
MRRGASQQLDVGTGADETLEQVSCARIAAECSGGLKEQNNQVAQGTEWSVDVVRITGVGECENAS